VTIMGELAVTVFIASLVGSVHCVGMCGPFVALTTLGRKKTRRPFLPTAAYNLGRGVSYAGVGAVAGTLGMVIDGGGALAGIQRMATMLAGLTMIVVGAVWLLDLVGGVRSASHTRSRWSRAITKRLRAGLAATERLAVIPRAATVGVLTSFMPCGWLYAFAITAAGTGSPGRGAAVMTAFWAGSVPILTLLGMSVGRISPWMRRRLPMLMAVLVLAVGVFTVTHRASIALPNPSNETTPSGEVITPDIPDVPPCHAS
jgi:uncharacterized protein